MAETDSEQFLLELVHGIENGIMQREGAGAEGRSMHVHTYRDISMCIL